MSVPNILDLDLDFFLDEIAYYRRPTDRCDDNEFKPWSGDSVRKFLEEQCRLSRRHPTPGRVVTHHHEAFHFWRDLIAKGTLPTPFDVVHIDAHSDLGLGDGGWRYLMSEHLHRPVSDRLDPPEGPQGLNPGNYLSFVLACRWLRNLTFVVHPKWRDDLQTFHFKDNDTGSGFLQLRACTKESLSDPIKIMYGSFDVASYEPEVPFGLVLQEDFVAVEPFTHVVLCKSPGFTPPAADDLIPVISEYLSPIPDENVLNIA